MRTRLVRSAAMTLCFAAFSAHGQTPGPGGGRPPPKEALDACADLKSGDACSFKVGSRTVDGTCRAPEGLPLACAPKGPPPPPKQAMDACDYKKSGDHCSFTFDGRQHDGICRTGPHGEVLQEVDPTLDLSAFVTARLEKTAKPHK